MEEELLSHAVLILALTPVGIVTVSVAGQKPPGGLKIDAVVSSRPYPFAQAARRFILDASWLSGDNAPLDIQPSGGFASEEICRIVLTSGSRQSEGRRPQPPDGDGQKCAV